MMSAEEELLSHNRFDVRPSDSLHFFRLFTRLFSREKTLTECFAAISDNGTDEGNCSFLKLNILCHVWEITLI